MIDSKWFLFATNSAAVVIALFEGIPFSFSVFTGCAFFQLRIFLPYSEQYSLGDFCNNCGDKLVYFRRLGEHPCKNFAHKMGENFCGNQSSTGGSKNGVLFGDSENGTF